MKITTKTSRVIIEFERGDTSDDIRLVHSMTDQLLYLLRLEKK